MLNQRYAAIDQGTTGTRVVVFGEDGKHFSPAAIAHKQLTPNPGWVEHDPMEILRNIRTCLSQCGVVDAIGLAHQGESVVAWDAQSGLPLYNAIIWQDQRTESVIRQLRNEGFEETIRAKTGLPLDTYFSGSKLGWIMRNVPGARELSRRGHLRLGTMDSFFMFHLCGTHITDYNSASRTSLFNIHTLQWDEELCRLFGVPIEALPNIRDNTGHFGDVTYAGNTTPLTACIVDQFAGTYGHGCLQAGQMKITFGTGAFLQSITVPRFPTRKAQDCSRHYAGNYRASLRSTAWMAASITRHQPLTGPKRSACTAISRSSPISRMNRPSLAAWLLSLHSPAWVAPIGIARLPDYGLGCRWKPSAKTCCSPFLKGSPCARPR